MSAAEFLEAEDAYFSTNPPPKQLAAHTALAEAFITQHVAANRRVVLVTSGGTTVPLEKNTVRFIDVCDLSVSNPRIKLSTPIQLCASAN